MRGSQNQSVAARNSVHSAENNNISQTIQLPKSGNEMEEVAGAQDTIYLCNFRVSVDGEWLCLKELQDMEYQESGTNDENTAIINAGISNSKSEENLITRDYANYCRCLFIHYYF